MARQVSVGSILRRGVEGMSPLQLQELSKDKDKLQALWNEIEKRVASLREMRGMAQALGVEVERREAAVKDGEAVLVKRRTDLEAEIVDLTLSRQASAEALARRTREVAERQVSATERETALAAREQEIEDHGRTREAELRTREEAIEAQEAIAEKRDEVQQKQVRESNERQRRLETAASMVRQAAASLG